MEGTCTDLQGHSACLRLGGIDLWTACDSYSLAYLDFRVDTTPRVDLLTNQQFNLRRTFHKYFWFSGNTITNNGSPRSFWSASWLAIPSKVETYTFLSNLILERWLFNSRRYHKFFWCTFFLSTENSTQIRAGNIIALVSIGPPLSIEGGHFFHCLLPVLPFKFLRHKWRPFSLLWVYRWGDMLLYSDKSRF